MEREGRVDHGAQPIERVLDQPGPRDHRLADRLVGLIEHGLEHRAEVREVEVQGRPLDAEGLGELAHRDLHPAGPQHVERRAGELAAAVEVGAAGHC